MSEISVVLRVCVIVSYIVVAVWAVFAVHDRASAALLGNLPNEAAMVHLQDFCKDELVGAPQNPQAVRESQTRALCAVVMCWFGACCCSHGCGSWHFKTKLQHGVMFCSFFLSFFPHRCRRLLSLIE